MEMGAADYIDKHHYDTNLLERAVRYAIERSAALEALRETERRLRHLSTRLVQAQESERKLIARELHDSVGSSLTAIRLALDRVSSKEGKTGSTREGMPLERIVDMVLGTIKEVQRISSNLRPSVLDHLGLLSAIRSFCRDFRELNPHLDLEATMDISEEEVPEALKILIYRILQESMNNISKHSGAKRAEIHLAKTPDGVRLSIRDDGKGFDRQKIGADSGLRQGLGISNMQERTELFNGTFSIESEEGRGTCITAFWPMPSTPSP
jgi:signal transduction histidine kinase